MSKLVHLCTSCQHPEGQHSSRESAFKPCLCCRKDRNAITVDPEPTLLPTFSFITGRPEPLHEPGTTRNPEQPAHREQFCGCDACQAAYAREAG